MQNRINTTKEKPEQIHTICPGFFFAKNVEISTKNAKKLLTYHAERGNIITERERERKREERR